MVYSPAMGDAGFISYNPVCSVPRGDPRILKPGVHGGCLRGVWCAFLFLFFCALVGRGIVAVLGS